MDRREPTFTLDVLENVLASAKARNFDLKYVNLLPQHYTQLADDLYQRLGMTLPPVDSSVPVIVLGVQLVVWRRKPNGEIDCHTPRRTPAR